MLRTPPLRTVSARHINDGPSVSVEDDGGGLGIGGGDRARDEACVARRFVGRGGEAVEGEGIHETRARKFNS